MSSEGPVGNGGRRAGNSGHPAGNSGRRAGNSGGGPPVDGTPRPGLRMVAQDRRMWMILGMVAVLVVCCCATAAGALVALSTGLVTAG
ncbi:hypothetical protein HCB17_10020 [Salinispora arenicola]|uniref:hypothetical protein n=1 Tax=Salinispora arenicola TaxID=168697 RepID=UPI0014305C2D|nr:hypothetical protein [Salinispora arenicola]NIL41473.1 hypothetical protein [Salinispora arenicola]